MRFLFKRSLWVWAAAAALGLLTVEARAADPATAAQVVDAEGNVTVYRSDQVWALFGGQMVHVGETIITGPDGFATLQVADGSNFLVYPNSRVVFRNNPGSLVDLLDVFLGRLRVHIQRFTGGAPNPHRVFTPTAVISVRGTTFDVDVDNNETTFVIVDEGVVTVNHRLMPSVNEVPVEAGQHIVVYRDIPLAQAGVDKSRVAHIAEDFARNFLHVWRRLGGQNPGGGSGPPLPGDTPAPPGPLPGDKPTPEAPPAPPD